jgi:hypothetical protein
VTKTADTQIVEEALRIIDQGLAGMVQRQLVSTNEVADLLLDLRMALMQAPAPQVAPA